MRPSSRSSARWRTCTFAARLYGLDGTAARRNVYAILDRLGIVGSDRVDRPDRADEPGDAAEGRDRAGPADEPDAAPPRRADDRPRPALEARRPGVHRGASAPTHDATIVLTTHDLAEAERLCDAITIIDGGRVVAADTPDGPGRVGGEPPRAPGDARDVFMAYTGRSLDDDVAEDAE